MVDVRTIEDRQVVGTGAWIFTKTDYVRKSDYDALAAELARCRTANVYDGNAHKRVVDLEAALRELAELGEQGMKPDYREWLTFHDKVAQIARKALGSGMDRP